MLSELSRENIPQLESSEKYSVLFYYNEEKDSALVEELSTILEASKDDSVLSNAYWFKCCVYPEEKTNFVGASIAAVIGIEIDNISAYDNVYAVMLEQKGKKFSTLLNSTPINKEALKSWLQSVQEGKATPSIKSEQRETNDDYPGKKGLKKLVASAFDEIVLDASKDVFVDIYADWCGPCQFIAPLIEKVASVLADEPSIVICKMNADMNDYSDKYFPEGTIPNMKLFKAGADLKDHPVKFNGERSAAGILTWLHENCVNKFDLDKHIESCKKFDSFFTVRLEAEDLVQETKEDLEYKDKCEESSVTTLEKLVQDLQTQIDEENTEEVTKLMETLRVSSDRSSIKEIAEKERLGNVKKIHSTEEFTEALTNDKLVVVDFTASWCGPCQYIAPIFASLSTKHTEVSFLKVDVDECSEVSANAGVQCMPTFQLYKAGSKIEEIQGADPEALEALIEKHK